jgi:hypothetical protein
MDINSIRQILEEVEKGVVKAGDALDKLRHIPYADLGVSKHDGHRALRNGFSEVILCEGKDLGHLFTIVNSLVERKINVFGTRATPEMWQMITDTLRAGVEKPDGSRLRSNNIKKVDFDPVSRTFRIIAHDTEPQKGRLAIVCAGTADMPVAEEARRTAEYFGFEAKRFYDVGVAGLHRLVSHLEELHDADCAIVVAGMEGALPSVVGGLVSCPIVACPTSVGYGANLKGFTALLAMLNSCSEGIAVVNIDNGFGAACAALRILRKIHPAEGKK